MQQRNSKGAADVHSFVLHFELSSSAEEFAVEPAHVPYQSALGKLVWR